MRKKLFLIFFITCIVLACISTTIFAAVNIDNIDDDKEIAGVGTLRLFGQYIYGSIWSIGIAVSVIVLAIIGIKYMLGSVEEKAQYKQTLMPYLIGAVLLFGASGIAQIIYEFSR